MLRKHMYRHITKLLPCAIYHPDCTLGVELCRVLLSYYDGKPVAPVPAGTVRLHGEDVDLPDLIAELIQHVGKPGENVRSYAVFQEEKVVRYLRLWVDEGGDFGAMGDRGEWLRDQLNALIRAFPSNSHCTERAVQAAVDTSVPFATKTGEAVVSTGVTQTMERRRKQRESGQEARDAKVAAGEAKKAKATAKAAAKAASKAAAKAMSANGATEEKGEPRRHGCGRHGGGDHKGVAFEGVRGARHRAAAGQEGGARGGGTFYRDHGRDEE